MLSVADKLSRYIGLIQVSDGQLKFVDPLVATGLKVAVSNKFPSSSAPLETVFVFDWDDTLLCTTSINRNRWGPEHLSELREAVRALLSAALILGEVYIVTNGGATWVADSTERFFPGLEPLLQQIKVISARSLYEDHFPSNTFAWKWHAFHNIFAPRKQRCPHGMNILVMGDSVDEIQAAIHTLHLLGPRSRVKTLKLVDQPGLDALVGQLRRVTRELRSIVDDTRSLNQKLLRHCDKKPGAVQAWDIGSNTTAFKSLSHGVDVEEFMISPMSELVISV